MSNSTTETYNLQGLGWCFEDFSGAYCTRKLVEFILSVMFLVVGTIILIVFVRKYRASRPFWLVAILSFLLGCLVVNIFFVFYNKGFWLYALQSFFYNMYYLMLVGYICYAFVLKHGATEKDDLMSRLNANLRQDEPKITHRVLFGCVLGVLIAIYFCIFITSLVYEVRYEKEEFTSKRNTINYCEEIWYLIFDVLCIALSVVVVLVMWRSQNEQYRKMVNFSRESRSRESSNVEDGFSDKDSELDRRRTSQMSIGLLATRMNNPFRNLWAWVGINVMGQIINLIESGFLLKAKPPMCYIMAADATGSNIISLILTLLTFYLCFGATLWYVYWVKILQGKTLIDRTVLFSTQINGQCNIQLFIPSRQQTISSK